MRGISWPKTAEETQKAMADMGICLLGWWAAAECRFKIPISFFWEFVYACDDMEYQFGRLRAELVLRTATELRADVICLQGNQDSDEFFPMTFWLCGI